MAWRLAKSLEKLRDQVNAAYPTRPRQSDGTIGDAAHARVPSDHNPNAQGVVTAMDITHGGSLDAHALADRLLANRHKDLKYIISNRRIAGDWTGWRWVAYNGTSDPHVNHIHVSVGRGDDGQSTGPYDDTNDWAVTGGKVTVPQSPQVTSRATGTAQAIRPANVRVAPNTGAAIGGSELLDTGETFVYVDKVQGQTVSQNGVTTNVWYQSQYGNYVWAGNLKDITNSHPAAPQSSSGTATVVSNANVRVAPTTKAAIGGSRYLYPGDTFIYVAKVKGENVGGNDIWYKSSKGNYVWSGNVRG